MVADLNETTETIETLAARGGAKLIPANLRSPSGHLFPANTADLIASTPRAAVEYMVNGAVNSGRGSTNPASPLEKSEKMEKHSYLPFGILL